MDALALIAQAGAAAALGSWLIYAIVIAAIIGIALVAARAAGVAVPQWVITIGWIVVVAVFAIAAIKFLLGLI
jgi:uncharacterized protein with PQ loop repeat